MTTEYMTQMLLALSGGNLELSRDLLEVARQNLNVNVQTLNAALERNKLEIELLESINALNKTIKELRL